MKKAIVATIILSACQAGAFATDIVDNVSVDRFQTERQGNYLQLDMTLGLKDLRVASNQCVLLTPRVVNGNDSITLPAIAVYGRNRYYYYQRNRGDEMLSGANELTFMAKNKPAEVAYHELFPYQEWMDGAKITLHRIDRGCCSKVLLQEYGELGRYDEAFFPELVFVQPKAEIMKSRSLSGSAYIDFPVDQTVIYPDYRRNTAELGKIQATIDSVRNDKDVTITSVWLKGFASPESPYKHNRDLAIGRTAALKNHIGQLYSFSDGIIQTDYEPEDWDGLRRFVEQSNIDHREEILALIDSDMEPDAKEAKIKRTYPKEYRFMLQQFYPALRHTDYRIDYNIRTFNDAEEIKRIMEKQPQKLSLNEFYLVAEKYEPGTDEFTDVFQTAVRMFPDDETANLNAANAAIRRDDFATARKYLDKAGDSAEAFYARGALAVREGDYETARRNLSKAKDLGMEKAAITLEELDKRNK